MFKHISFPSIFYENYVHITIVIVSLFFILGMPILYFWKMIILFFSILVLFSADRVKRWQYQCVAYGVFLICLVSVFLIPKLEIQEGSNSYLPAGEGRSEYTELPADINHAFLQRFMQIYPPEHWCNPEEYGCWRYFGRTGGTYAFSSSSFWENAKYSRIVNDINFTSVGNFNGGFLNNISAVLGNNNWYDHVSDVRRNAMPFFVMYEIPRELVGSFLCWQGDVWWGSKEGYQQLSVLDTEQCRLVRQADIDQRIYGFSILPEKPLAIRLDLANQIKFYQWLERLLQILGCLSLLSLFKYRRKSTFFIFCIGLLGLCCYVIWLDPDITRHNYPIAGGGGDGLTYISYGHHIFYSLAQGQWMEALRGVESVFYFMPGARYIWALFKLLFGDTNIGYMLMLLTTFTIVSIITLRMMLPWLAVITIIFFYLFFAKTFFVLMLHSSAEGLGYTFFLCAFLLAIYRNSLEYISYFKLWSIGFFMFLAVFCRPNLAIAALFFISFLAFLFLKKQYWKKTAALGLGFSCIIFLPWHNYYYGNEWVFLTSAMDISVNLHITPITYWIAIQQWLNILPNDSSSALAAVSHHWKLWLPTLWHQCAIIIFLIGLFWVRNWKCLLLALSILGLQIPLLFWSPFGRYAVLAWLLTAFFMLLIIQFLLQKAKPSICFIYINSFLMNLATKIVNKA